MEQINIINPAAGQGGGVAYINESHCFVSSGVGDIEEYTYRACMANPETHITVYGGDGSVNEAVNGVMRAEAGRRAVISVVPTGTGNDFARSFAGKRGIFETDLINCNGRYAVNALNIGFDSDVVTRAAKLKKLPLVSGSLAYILGVAGAFFSPMGEKLSITLTDESGGREVMDGSFLLCVISNAAYYGGGFMPAPLAATDDGLLELTAVSKVSRTKFLSLVGDYKNGRHINRETRGVAEKFATFIKYRRCREVEISGFRRICTDGELYDGGSVAVSVAPRAIKFLF